jgi:uncharacterized protein
MIRPLATCAMIGFLAAIALVGCSHTGPNAQAPVPTPPAPVRVGTATGALQVTQVTAAQQGSPATPSPEELRDDTNVAVQVVNDYWAQHWSDFFTGTYQPPTVWGTYDSSTGGGPTCGGQPPLPDNAFYCATGEDFLAWDSQLMAKGAQFGDAWVYLVVAHEWGHAIQYRLDRSLTSLSAELQADCLAGAVLYGAARDGTLLFEQGDEEEGEQDAHSEREEHGEADEVPLDLPLFALAAASARHA